MNEVRLTASKKKWIGLLIITLVAGGLLSPWASSQPDGLERVAEDHGFLEKAGAVHEWAPIPDYEVAGIPWSAVRVGLAGVIGAAIMITVLWGALRSLSGHRRGTDAGSNHGEGTGASG